MGRNDRYCEKYLGFHLYPAVVLVEHWPRVRTQDRIVLDLHMPIQEYSALLKEIQQQVQQCLNQQLLDQAITRQKYPPAEELQTSSSNRGKQMLAAYDSGLQSNLPYAIKNSRRFLYSKRFKEVVEEAIGLVSEDFRLSDWQTLLKSNEENCTYDDSYYDIDTSVIWLNKILTINNINKDRFFKDVKSVMDKSVMKINTLWFYGPSNVGKSLIANSIVESARFFCNIIDFNERTSFPLNDAPGKRVILINEPDIGERRIELVKNIMEGQDVAINVKNQMGVTLPRTPLVFCSNKTLWHFCMNEASAIMNRRYMYTFNTYDDLDD